MVRYMFFMVFMTLASVVPTASAQDAVSDEEAAVATAMANFVELGPGVHSIQKDKKGRILSCVVVGQARISTALGKAKGLELARDKANLACSAKFVQWLKEEVTVSQLEDEETVVLLEGAESSDAESFTESGKAVEKSSKKMESVSKGLVRGLQLLHTDVDGEGKAYTIVKGWKADTAEGVKKVSSDLASDESKFKDGKVKRMQSELSEAKPNAKKTEKSIESRKATSGDASDFLPK